MPAHVERLCDVGRLDVAPRLGLTVLHVDLLGARESDTPEVQAVTTDATVPLGQVLTGRVRRIAYLAHELGIMTADHDNEGTKQTNELERLVESQELHGGLQNTMELKQRITRTAEVRRRFSPNRRLGAAVKRPGHNNDPRLQQAWPTTTPGKSNA